MKIQTIVYSQTLYGNEGDDSIRNSLNDLLKDYKITPENLIDIKINTHSVYNVLMPKDSYLNEDDFYEFEEHADYTSTRYVATIIYKTEE